ncbi:MAG: hypothetical protein J7K40_11305 [candidate division Zixibacteria bacterium]|nr:hypothetical protein [candidate division Zixibacteria bacterium]
MTNLWIPNQVGNDAGSVGNDAGSVGMTSLLHPPKADKRPDSSDVVLLQNFGLNRQDIFMLTPAYYMINYY